jgi:hypothetical protein
VDRSNPEFKAPWNQIRNIPRVFTPEDRAVQTPNSDTPYSMLGLDLRTEPIVLSVPDVDADRYYSVQLIDAYTFNLAYIGSRVTGNDAGHFLIAGPRWQGPTPEGITRVIRAETELVLAAYRTQLFRPDDLERVVQIQAGYKVQPLSAFLGEPAPPAAPAIDFPAPLSPEQERTSLDFFKILNFVLQFCPTHPSETELRARFARLGIGGGEPFDPARLTPELKTAIEQGMADAWQDFAAAKKRVDAGTLTSGDVFGDRASLKNNYLYRMVAAVIGIYGNTKQEAMYPVYTVDADGQPLSGAHRYTLRFAPDALPPVDAFWSLTMYRLPESLLVPNRLNRYLINSPMLPQLQRDADGGLTLYLQHDAPGADKESNWLPAPEGSFTVFLRLYSPRAASLDGTWKQPPLKRVPGS